MFLGGRPRGREDEEDCLEDFFEDLPFFDETVLRVVRFTDVDFVEEGLVGRETVFDFLEDFLGGRPRGLDERVVFFDGLPRRVAFDGFFVTVEDRVVVFFFVTFFVDEGFFLGVVVFLATVFFDGFFRFKADVRLDIDVLDVRFEGDFFLVETVVDCFFLDEPPEEDGPHKE